MEGPEEPHGMVISHPLMSIPSVDNMGSNHNGSQPPVLLDPGA